MNGLKYIGRGFKPGVPARDLSPDEVEKYGGEEKLLASGLYERIEKQSKPAAASAEKPKRRKKRNEV